MMVNREALASALMCRMSTHYGITCSRCPYGLKTSKRWACDMGRICGDALAVMREDAMEINSLSHKVNEFKVRLMARGESVK